MEQSETIKELTGALVAATGEFGQLVPDKTNPHFKSKYASLAQCIDVTRPALCKHGLAVSQWLENAPDGYIAITTQLAHVSGEWVRSSSLFPMGQQTAQQAGSSLTYARRYTYCAALGLAPDEDDDGNGAQPQQRKAQQPKPVPAPVAENPIEAKRKAYFANAAKLGLDGDKAQQTVKALFNLESFNDATVDQLREAYMAIKDAHDQAHNTEQEAVNG